VQHLDSSASMNVQISNLIAQLVAASRASEPSGERLLRWPELSRRVPYCHSTIYNLMAKDLFPKARSLGGGRGVGWPESEINAWIASREIAAPPPNRVTRKRRGVKSATDKQLAGCSTK
jgi:predicted DNA-binding transcriptional regulator AlpA